MFLYLVIILWQIWSWLSCWSSVGIRCLQQAFDRHTPIKSAGAGGRWVWVLGVTKYLTGYIGRTISTFLTRISSFLTRISIFASGISTFLTRISKLDEKKPSFETLGVARPSVLRNKQQCKQKQVNKCKVN